MRSFFFWDEGTEKYVYNQSPGTFLGSNWKKMEARDMEQLLGHCKRRTRIF